MPSGAEAEARDPVSVAPEDAKVTLSEEARRVLAQELILSLENHDQAMVSRVEMWSKIGDAYSLVADADTSGQMPNATRFVSEITRSHSNIAASRLRTSIFAATPLLRVEVWDDQADDEETAELVDEAAAVETFLDNYLMLDVDFKKFFRRAAARLSKTGAGVVEIEWQASRKSYWYKRTPKGDPERVDRGQGKLVFKMIRNEQCIFWPLSEPEIAKLSIAGYRTYNSPASFRLLASQLKLSPDITQRALDTAEVARSPSEQALERELEGKDINIREVFSMRGEVCTTLLNLQNYVLPGQTEPGNYRLFMNEQIQEILSITHNPRRCQRHNMFLLPYWEEDNCIWPSGVGHEVVYNQKADSSLMNMALDNLKVIGNVLRIVKAGRQAESMQDQLRPGGVIVTEEPDEDFRTESLGGDLTWILEMMQGNAHRATLNSSATPIEHGGGDPILKSGASPGSIAQLREGSGSKFGDVDESIRGVISDIGAFCLDEIQQYAPAEVIYSRASEDSAEKVMRGKFRVPLGDMRQKFRFSPKSPKATDNKEVRQQRLLMMFQLFGGYLPMMSQYADQVMQPAQAQAFKTNLAEFYNDELLLQVIEGAEIPGLGGSTAPRIPEVEPQLEQLMQQNQELQQQMQQMMQMQQPQGGMEGGGQPVPSAPMAAPQGF